MLLVVRSVIKTFPGAERPVLSGASLTLAAGESLALTGDSGSGKSTLLHIVGGLEAADAGEVVVDGTEIGALDDAGRARLRRETVAVVFQQFNLIPSLDVRANIAFQARLAGRHDTDRAAALADRLGLTSHLSKYPEQLSGGQQQRVAIARALAARPRLVLADEPTGNLDARAGAEVADLMRDMVTETGAGLLCVTHSTRLAARMDRQARLVDGCVIPAGTEAAA